MDLEAAFGRLNGVMRTATGYCGGTLKKPTYREVKFFKKMLKNAKNSLNPIQNTYLLICFSKLLLQVCEGITGHTEAVKVFYDKQTISYKSLCDIFWETHDPTNRNYLVINDLSIHFPF